MSESTDSTSVTLAFVETGSNRILFQITGVIGSCFRSAGRLRSESGASNIDTGSDSNRATEPTEDRD